MGPPPCQAAPWASELPETKGPALRAQLGLKRLGGWARTAAQSAVSPSGDPAPLPGPGLMPPSFSKTRITQHPLQSVRASVKSPSPASPPGTVPRDLPTAPSTLLHTSAHNSLSAHMCVLCSQRGICLAEPCVTLTMTLRQAV